MERNFFTNLLTTPGYIIGPGGKCQASGTCQPYLPNACDQRRNEECLPDDYGGFTCQCPVNQIRHPVTQICCKFDLCQIDENRLVDECASGIHDCDRNANCINTDEGYICTCKEGHIDESPDQARKPGRVCRPRTCLFHR
ncbi:unnamed protein product [Onchocerca flexuosa]|uniref:EGF-like domain-containing protein n=1 Tax=Onchocerca flexuosa TaxID=387005 RepID=A0A183HP71_9BILA|nr:unnamed protein product [Onchocerca flexuosa]